MSSRTIRTIVVLWWAGVVWLGLQAPDAYGVACLVLPVCWLALARVPGFITANAVADYSGKGHRTNLPRGCFPFTFVLDVVTAPLQLPLLVPLTVERLRTRRDRRTVEAIARSPERVKELVEKARTQTLEDQEFRALEEACGPRSSIESVDVPLQMALGMIPPPKAPPPMDPEDVRTLIELFGGTLGDRDSDGGLAGLIKHQPLSTEDLRRVFEIEKSRGHVERSIRVPRHHRALVELARHPDTPADVLQGIVEMEATGIARHAASERLREGRRR